jgi:NDP-sugar pyrophosphorylase family protein
MIKQAFVLGAGLGLRLRPMTEHMPKPLVPIFNKQLITFSLDHLRSLGVDSFVINTHRLPEEFHAVFGSGEYEGLPVKLAHEPDLLETGGGIKNAEPLLRADEPFITYSGDILTDIELQPLIDEHFAKGNDVTLGLREDGLSTDIALSDGRVVDIAGKFGTERNLRFRGRGGLEPDDLQAHRAEEEDVVHPDRAEMDRGRREDRRRGLEPREVVQHRLSFRLPGGASHDSRRSRGGRAM